MNVDKNFRTARFASPQVGECQVWVRAASPQVGVPARIPCKRGQELRTGVGTRARDKLRRHC
eukprot:46862-Hanusia_phi.AAC.1